MSASPDTTIKDLIEKLWIKRTTHKGIEEGFAPTGETAYPGAITEFVEMEFDGTPAVFAIKIYRVE